MRFTVTFAVVLLAVLPSQAQHSGHSGGHVGGGHNGFGGGNSHGMAPVGSGHHGVLSGGPSPHSSFSLNGLLHDNFNGSARAHFFGSSGLGLGFDDHGFLDHHHLLLPFPPHPVLHSHLFLSPFYSYFSYFGPSIGTSVVAGPQLVPAPAPILPLTLIVLTDHSIFAATDYWWGMDGYATLLRTASNLASRLSSLILI